jgi:hypothetical protein
MSTLFVFLSFFLSFFFFDATFLLFYNSKQLMVAVAILAVIQMIFPLFRNFSSLV